MRATALGLDYLGDTSEPLPYKQPSKEEIEAFFERSMRPGLAAFACGIAGAFLWSEHRHLGFLGGLGLGWHGTKLLTRQSSLGIALAGLATTGAAVGGSLLWKERQVRGPDGQAYTRGHPAWGYVLGGLAGNLAAAAVAGGSALEKKA